MDHGNHLWLFFTLVFGIIALPGMDMAFVLSNALAGGRKSGLFAVAGIVVGGMCHVLAASLGVAWLISTVPGLMQAMLLAGAAYLAWIGWSVWHSHTAMVDVQQVAPSAPLKVFRQAMVTCLLNPKAYLFMLAVFPQFLHPDDGGLLLQSTVLGGIIALTQMGIYGTLALAAAKSRQWLIDSPGALSLAGRAIGAMLMMGAVLTAATGLKT